MLTADGNGKVDFKTPTESVAPAMQGNLVGEDTVINIDGGTDVLFGADGKETKISINTGGITSKHIQNETIINDDIANKTIRAGKLDATGATAGAVATVQGDGSVAYQSLSTTNITNKGELKVKDGITVDDGEGKVFADVSLGLADGQVAPTKLTPGADKYLLVTKGGKAEWVEAKDEIIKDAVNSNETITVLRNIGKGIYTYFNEEAVKNNTAGVNIDVNSLSIDSSKPGVYVFKDLSSDNPLATIDIASDVINSIVTILGDTNVKAEVYKIVAAQGKAITSTDGSLNIPIGNQAGLADLNIEIANAGVKTKHIADGQVTAAKLVADGDTQAGFVATVNGDGTVSYKSLTDTDVSSKAAALKTDSIIQVDGGDTKAGVLFSEATLSIKDKGIGTDQLADESVTADKLSSIGVGKNKILISGDNNEVVWEGLPNLVATAAGDLKGDDIIVVKNADGTTDNAGVKALFKEVQLGIADKSITKEKLSSVESTGVVIEDMLLATDGLGGFYYVEKEAVQAGGEDLKLGTALQFADATDGKLAVLAPTTIDVKDKGITPAKISSIGADKNTVLTADGQGNVAYEKLSETAFDGKGADLKSTGSLSIPAGNQAVLKETTIDISKKGVKTDHIADENVTTAKLKGGVAKQLLITNDGGKAQWVDGTDTIIKDIVTAYERVTVLTDKQDGTFTYQNETDIANGTPGVLFNANTLTITDNGKGKYVFTDKSGNGDLAIIDIQATVINNITELLKEVSVKEEIYNVIASQGKKVSEGDAIAITGGDKAALSEMTIGLKDEGVTPAKISSIGADKNAVLTADGQGKVAYVKLSETAFDGKGAELKSDGSLEIPKNNKAILADTTIGIADGGVQAKHIAPKAVTVDKIGTNEPEGKVLTSNGEGGAAFKTLREVVGQQGKAIKGDSAIHVEGGKQAALTEVTLSLNNSSITNEKLATNSVSVDKIKDKAVTAAKMLGEQSRTILITDVLGEVRWADANETVIKDIVEHVESLTLLRDNQDGTLTYFNEGQVDNKGNLVEGAVGVTFDANTLTVDTTTPGIYILKDKSKENEGVVGIIDTRASNIIFEGNVGYTNVEEAITNITQKIDQLEKVEIQKAPLSGKGILVDGKASVADVVFKAVELSIADNAITTSKLVDENITTQKIKGGKAKQLLVTNIEGKTEWVDASSDIIKDIVQTQERVTILVDNEDGTFTYFSEKDVDKDGNKIGAGVRFDANTLKIEVAGKGKYDFYDKSQDTPLATIDVAHDVIENILEILKDVKVKEEIYNVVAAQGKKVSTDAAIEVVGGDQAVLNPMSIALKRAGVTEDKLFGGLGKADYVPVVQEDGTVKYQSMDTVLTGKLLSVDNSLEVTGENSKALLEELGLKVKADGIGSVHIQNLAVTTDKISSTASGVTADKGAVLVADGGGNVKFVDINTAAEVAMQGDLVGDEAIEVIEGGNVLLGEDGKEVKLSLKKGGVKGTHIASGTVKNTNIADSTIQAGKLTAGTGEGDRVAVANAAGEVSYKVLTTANLGGKGSIHTADGLTVNDGVGKTLADVTLGIADQSLSIAKLDGANAPMGSVPVVGANGKEVSYQVLNADVIQNKGDITSDGSLIASEKGVGKALENVEISVAPKGIITAKIADNAVENLQIADLAVTANKISSKGVQAKSVLISGSEDNVFWGELGDIVTDTAGNLTTDSIIEMTGGDGVNTLLKDVNLSIANQSITRDKLSSKEGDTPVNKDLILITNGTGGFDYVEQNAVQVGGKDLHLGESLQFTKGNGLNTVLVETSIDVAEGGVTNGKLATGAVTVDKISAGNAAANTVLTAVGEGKVAYKALNNTAFDGQGVDLTADTSITVTADNKALLNEAKIAIAKEGVKNTHIANQAVTTEKISSLNGKNNFEKGTFLTADGSGATTYQTLDAVATTQGKAITSKDGSLTVPVNKAGLQALDITLAKGGVKNEHINGRAITQENISTPEQSIGLVLTSDGQGGAEFKNVNESVLATAKPLVGGSGITVTGSGAAKALLGDATVTIANKGVSNAMIADGAVNSSKIASKTIISSNLADSAVDGVNIKDGAVTVAKIGANAVTEAKIANQAVSTTQLKDKAVNVDKISSDAALEGFVLTANGKGGVEFKQAVGAELKGKIHGEGTPISVSKGANAVPHDVLIGIKDTSIEDKHLASNAVITAKIANNAVTTDKIDGSAVTTAKIANTAITTAKIANDAVGYDQLRRDAVSGDVVKDRGIENKKISSHGAPEFEVLTSDGKGGTRWAKVAKNDSGTGDLDDSSTIKVASGKGDGALFHDLTLEVKDESIENKHIKEESIKAEKLSSIDEGNNQVPEGKVLTSDGNGGVEWKEGAKAAKAAMPKFFYAPAFFITVEPGDEDEIDVYEYYKQQFGNPKAVNSKAQSKTLPVLKYDELDYYVLYYDEDVFEWVRISDYGDLEYKVRNNAQVSTNTYFNIVFGVRE